MTEEYTIPAAPTNPAQIEIVVTTQTGCSFDSGEFELRVTKILSGSLGDGDFEMLWSEAFESLNQTDLPEEGSTAFIATETGEWVGVCWNKYYVLEKADVVKPGGQCG